MASFLEQLQQALTNERVFGEPIERDGVVVIPAARVRGGGGGGADDREETGAFGGGFGLTAHPVGVYVLSDGEVRWEPAVDVTRIALAGMTTWVVGMLVVRSILRRRQTH